MTIEVPPKSIVPLKPGFPRRGFLFHGRLSVGDGEAGADHQSGQLIDRVAAGAPVRELLLIEALGHARLPFAGVRADHRAGVKLPAINAHGAAEAAADLESGFDHGVAGETRRDRLETETFRAGCGGPFRSSSAGGYRV